MSNRAHSHIITELAHRHEITELDTVARWLDEGHRWDAAVLLSKLGDVVQGLIPQATWDHIYDGY